MERLLAEDMITFEFLWKVFKIGQKICDKHLTFRDAVRLLRQFSGLAVNARGSVRRDAGRDQDGYGVRRLRVPVVMSHLHYRHFHLAGHTLAWNGTEYISVKWTHDIMPFGVRSPHTAPLLPHAVPGPESTVRPRGHSPHRPGARQTHRYAPPLCALLSRTDSYAAERGRKYVQFSGIRHVESASAHPVI